MKSQDRKPPVEELSGDSRGLSVSSAGRWLLGVVILTLLLAAALLMTLPRYQSPLLVDPRFVVTTKPILLVPANAPFKDRWFVWWMQFQEKHGKPHPLSYSFGASPRNRCSIHGLLNQCMEVAGTRYLIAKDVAGGTVMFGPTNTLNGAQWVKAFTEALQTAQPEWWDSQTKKFRKENLVLLTNGPRMVLVLPRDMVGEFRPATAR